MAGREHNNKDTLLAAALLALGHIPHEHAKLMTAAQVISLFQFDHYPIRKADGGPDEPWNLRPLGIMAHRVKTAEKDAPEMARNRDVQASEAIHRAKLALKEGNHVAAGQILATVSKRSRLKPKHKINSPGFQQNHRPLRSRSSFGTRKKTKVRPVYEHDFWSAP
jgi:hypothetical protein